MALKLRPWIVGCLAFAAWADNPRTLEIQFDTEAVSAYGISLEGATAQLTWPAGPLELAVRSLQPGDGTPLSNLQIRCAVVSFEAGGSWRCDDGLLSFDHPLSSPRDMPVSLRWHPEAGGDLRLADVPLAGRQVTALIRRNEEIWRVTVETSGTDLGILGTVAPLAGLELAGEATVHAEIEFAGGALRHVDLAVEHSDTRLQDAGAAFAGDGLTGRITLTMDAIDEQWQGQVEGRWKRGEILTPFAYLQATHANPLSVSAGLTTDSQWTGLTLRPFTLTQAPWLAIEGNAALDLAAPPLLRRLDARLSDTDAGDAFSRYLEPVIVQPLLAGLHLSGRAGGRISLRNGNLAGLQVELNNISATVGADNGPASIEGLDARVEFGAGTSQSGSLRWRSARVFDFAVGAAQIPLSFGNKTLATGAPVTIPLLDGGVEIDRFALDWNPTPPVISFDAILLPVSMEAVTTALGWLPMKGRLSGMLPRVTIGQGGLEVGGNLLVQVFDGTVVIRNLEVSDVFGYWPVLTADAECERLDLEMLTGTYEFGRITGRVDGTVQDLRLENWRPTAFDARFETTPGDDTRHRISQRAVDNITSLSGGPAGAASRTFLRFFDEFNYDRLGIACRLRNGVCHMDGVEPAETGYYLVKGGGIPRIDVIGFNRSTDWDLLVDRLGAITESGPPIIE